MDSSPNALSGGCGSQRADIGARLLSLARTPFDFVDAEPRFFATYRVFISILHGRGPHERPGILLSTGRS